MPFVYYIPNDNSYSPIVQISLKERNTEVGDYVDDQTVIDQCSEYCVDLTWEFQEVVREIWGHELCLVVRFSSSTPAIAIEVNCFHSYTSGSSTAVSTAPSSTTFDPGSRNARARRRQLYCSTTTIVHRPKFLRRRCLGVSAVVWAWNVLKGAFFHLFSHFFR